MSLGKISARQPACIAKYYAPGELRAHGCAGIQPKDATLDAQMLLSQRGRGRTSFQDLPWRSSCRPQSSRPLVARDAVWGEWMVHAARPRTPIPAAPEVAQGTFPGVPSRLLCPSEGGAGTFHLSQRPLSLEAGLYGALTDCGGGGRGSLKGVK